MDRPSERRKRAALARRVASLPAPRTLPCGCRAEVVTQREHVPGQGFRKEATSTWAAVVTRLCPRHGLREPGAAAEWQPYLEAGAPYGRHWKGFRRWERERCHET